MKLLLTSSGLTNRALQEAFLSLIDKKPEEITVGHVITAALGEKGDPYWVRESLSHLITIGVTKIEDIDVKDKSKEELENFFQDKDVIFVNGGNTYYLLKYAKESGFMDVVSKQVTDGKIYLGLSAGSILANPTIQTSGWEPADENEVGITDLTALSFVPFLITPHFTQEYKAAIEAQCQKIKLPVIALTDEQAVLYTDKGYEIVGEGEKIIYENGNTDFKNSLL